MGDVAPELVPALMLEAAPFEYVAALGDRPAIGFANLGAGGAGIRSVAQINNPAGSGVLCIIERIDFVANAGAADLVIRTADTNFSGVSSSSAFLRDLRLSGKPACTLFGDNTHAQAGGNVIGVINHLNPRLEAGPSAGLWVINPGNTLTFDGGADNQAFELTMFWREKQADASELNLTG